MSHWLSVCVQPDSAGLIQLFEEQERYVMRHSDCPSHAVDNLSYCCAVKCQMQGSQGGTQEFVGRKLSGQIKQQSYCNEKDKPDQS